MWENQETRSFHDNFTNSSIWHNDSATDYCSSFYVASQVVYSSITEKIVTLTVLMVVLAVTLLGQLSVIVTIIKTERLHIPNFVVILCYCAGDLVMVTTSTVLYVWHFVYYCMSLALCQALSIVGITAAFGLASLTGLMAYERYVYLCQPLKYDTRCRTRMVVIISGVIYVAPLVFCLVTEAMYGRSYHATILVCALPASAIRSVVQFALFIFPAAITTVVCMHQIWRVMKTCSVAPVLPENVGTSEGRPTGANPRKHAKKTFKMVAMVSGTFWATMLPTMIIRMLLFAAGFTWPDLDIRLHYTASLSLRIITYMFSSVSSLLNPFIYYYSRRDLREALMKLVGLSNRVALESSSTSVQTSRVQ